MATPRADRLFALVLALLAGSSACGPRDAEDGASFDTHEVRVLVLDLFEQPVDGALVASTRDGKRVDAAVTSATGEAVVDAAADGELTAYAPTVAIQYHTAVTLFAVGTASEATLSFVFWAVAPAPTPTPPIVLVSTSSNGVAGATTSVAAAGSCDTTGSPASTLAVPIEADCVQTDGQVTLHAHLENDADTMLAWGALADEAASGGAVTIAVTTTTTTIAAQVLSPPNTWSGYASYTPVRKGQPVARFQPVLIAGSSSAAVFGGGIATSIRAQAYASVGAGREARITTGTAAGSPAIVDFATALPFGDELAASIDGGVPSVSWIAPEVVGADFFRIQMGWSGVESPYLWFAYGPDSLATGEQTIRMPPAPRERPDWEPADGAEILNAALTFEDLSYLDGYDAEALAAPYPEIFVHRRTSVSD